MASVHGYTQAFIVSAGFLLLALAAVWTMVTTGRLSTPAGGEDAGATFTPSLV